LKEEKEEQAQEARKLGSHVKGLWAGFQSTPSPFLLTCGPSIWMRHFVMSAILPYSEDSSSQVTKHPATRLQLRTICSLIKSISRVILNKTILNLIKLIYKKGYQYAYATKITKYVVETTY
jgi:hypothetical protein